MRLPRQPARPTVPLRALPAAALACCAAALPVAAHEDVAQRLEITGHYDNRLGSSDSASQGLVGASLMRNRPVGRPGEVLEFVPGVIVTQHSGEGKANQVFLRGFNLDHGTDFATSVNGMPVNLPSHGHGQGYADLNFLMPELVQRMAYQKGPYHARSGDFASAGSADIAYRTRLDAPLAQFTVGSGAHRRALLAGSTALGSGVHLLAALEAQQQDGPWTLPEGLRKRNGLLTLSGGTPGNGWQTSLMAYRNRWNATDQVPERLLAAGTLQGRPFGRFDTVDSSDGGQTARDSLSLAWQHVDGQGHTTRVNAHVLRYRLQLYSNFTYALERPAEGDQFLQSDRRSVAGLSASRTLDVDLGRFPAHLEAGLQLRQDRATVGLGDTAARQLLRTTREDQVRQRSAGAYVQAEVDWLPELRSTLGLRADHVATRVNSLTLADNSGRASALLLSPKLSVVARPGLHTELFFNAGRGMHSNDARGTTLRTDPKTGDPADAVPPLVASRGAELGLKQAWSERLHTSVALWWLALESELVYVGDGGGTEPQPASRRRGLEVSQRWQALPWLWLDADLALNHARFTDGQRIPNAVDTVAALGLTVPQWGPWRAHLQWRYLGSGALVEDNSVRSRPAFTGQLRLAYDLAAALPGVVKRGSELTLDVFNIANRRVNDIQYFYESRLPGEAEAVADRHVHPAAPRSLRLGLRLTL